MQKLDNTLDETAILIFQKLYIRRISDEIQPTFQNQPWLLHLEERVVLEEFGSALTQTPVLEGHIPLFTLFQWFVL